MHKKIKIASVMVMILIVLKMMVLAPGIMVMRLIKAAQLLL